MSSDFYNDAWYDARWEAVPPVMRKMAVDAIKKVVSDDDFALIRRKHAQHGHDWIHHLIDLTPEEQEYWRGVLPEDEGVPETLGAHHGFGTQIRNVLRDEELGAGIPDDALPEAPYENWKHEGVGPRNWDDYYVAAIEAAAGVREV